MNTPRIRSALELNGEQLGILYCAGMLGMVVAMQGRDTPEPDVLDKAQSWAVALRELGEEKVVLTMTAFHESLKAAGLKVEA